MNTPAMHTPSPLSTCALTGLQFPASKGGFTLEGTRGAEHHRLPELSLSREVASRAITLTLLSARKGKATRGQLLVALAVAIHGIDGVEITAPFMGGSKDIGMSKLADMLEVASAILNGEERRPSLKARTWTDLRNWLSLPSNPREGKASSPEIQGMVDHADQLVVDYGNSGQEYRIGAFLSAYLGAKAESLKASDSWEATQATLALRNEYLVGYATVKAVHAKGVEQVSLEDFGAEAKVAKAISISKEVLEGESLYEAEKVAITMAIEAMSTTLIDLQVEGQW